jgi:hypothetical protein
MIRIRNSRVLFQFLIISLALTSLVVTYTLVKAGQTPNPQPPLAPDTTGEYNCITAGYSCVAQDVKVKELVAVQIMTPCTGNPAYATVRFRVMVEAASPDRYDIGTFISLDGDQVQGNGNQCYHDYYEVPLNTAPDYGDFNIDTIPDLFKDYPAGTFTGFKNAETKDTADFCGDIDNVTQIFKVQDETISIRCADTINDAGAAIPDGYVDLYACASWDNNAQSTCTGITGAVPGTQSKCGCNRINTRIPTNPTAVLLMDFDARSLPGQVLVRWETGSELDAIGFNLYRSTSLDGVRTSLNEALIPSKSVGGMGASYEFIDADVQPGVDYYYWLEFVDGAGMPPSGPAQVKAGSSWLFLPAIRNR